MTNGGTGPYYGRLILINSGRGELPPNIALVDPYAPNDTTIILDNYFGRQFNSLNDIKIHRQSGMLFFTDVTYVLTRRIHLLTVLISDLQLRLFDEQIPTDTAHAESGVPF